MCMQKFICTSKCPDLGWISFKKKNWNKCTEWYDRQFIFNCYWDFTEKKHTKLHNLQFITYQEGDWWIYEGLAFALHLYFEHLLHLMKMMIPQQLKNFESYLFHYLLWLMLKFFRELSSNRQSSQFAVSLYLSVKEFHCQSFNLKSQTNFDVVDYSNLFFMIFVLFVGFELA